MAPKHFLKKENQVISFVSIGVKRTFLWSINILQQQHVWEKSGSQVTAKNGSWPMRF